VNNWERSQVESTGPEHKGGPVVGRMGCCVGKLPSEKAFLAGGQREELPCGTLTADGNAVGDFSLPMEIFRTATNAVETPAGTIAADPQADRRRALPLLDDQGKWLAALVHTRTNEYFLVSAKRPKHLPSHYQPLMEPFSIPLPDLVKETIKDTPLFVWARMTISEVGVVRLKVFLTNEQGGFESQPALTFTARIHGVFWLEANYAQEPGKRGFAFGRWDRPNKRVQLALASGVDPALALLLFLALEHNLDSTRRGTGGPMPNSTLPTC